MARSNYIWKARFLKDFGHTLAATPGNSNKTTSGLSIDYECWMEGYRDFAVAPSWDPAETDVAFTSSLRNRKLVYQRGAYTKWPKAIALHSVSTSRSRVLRFAVSGRFELALISAPSKEVLSQILRKSGTGTDLHTLLQNNSIEGRVSMLSIYSRRVTEKTPTAPPAKTPNNNKFTFFSNNNNNNDKKNKALVEHPYAVRYHTEEHAVNTVSLYVNSERQTVMWEVNTGVGCETPMPGPSPMFLVYAAAEGKRETAIVSLNERAYPSS